MSSVIHRLTTMKPIFSNLTRRSRLAAVALLGLAATAGSLEAQNSRFSMSIGVNVPPGGREFYSGRDRYYAYRGSYYRWDRGQYYRSSPPRGYYVRQLPPGYSRVFVGSQVYYHTDHFYYRPYGNYYEVVEMPVIEQPVRVVRPAALPPPAPSTLAEVWLGNQRYVLSNGQYFKPTSQGREWVPVPVGARIKSLPIGTDTVWYQEQEFFEFDGGIFRRSPEGYRVVEAPWKETATTPAAAVIGNTTG